MSVSSTPLMFACLVLALGGSGCGSSPADPYQRQPVHGLVRLDGQPLVNGSITFVPVEPGPVVSGAMIAAGEFHIPAQQGLPPGNYQVSITAAGPVDTTTKDPEELMANPTFAVSLIPEKYNAKSTLQAKVKQSEPNRFEFELSSK